MCRRPGVPAISLLAVVLIPLAFLAQAGSASKTSTFGFMVQEQGIRLVVNTETAAWKKKPDFLPLVIFIGNSTLSSASVLTLNRYCFTLTDPIGQTHSLCTLKEIQDGKNYGFVKVANDYTFIQQSIEAGPDVQSFNGLSLQPGTCFFTNVRGQPSMIRDQVQIRPNGFTTALLYFANPSGRAKGTYKLTYTDPTTKASVTVPFEIAWK